MDLLRLVFRYFRTRKIAWVASVCIAVSVTAMIVVTSVMAGFRERIIEQVRGAEPDLGFRLKGVLPLRHFEEVKAELAGEMAPAGGPILALAPRLETVGIVFVRAEESDETVVLRQDPVKIIGIDYELERHVIPLERMIADVKDPELSVEFEPGVDPLKGNGPVAAILPGFSFATQLGLVARHGFRIAVADQATVLSGRLSSDLQGKTVFEPSNLLLRVAGAFVSGQLEFDRTHLFMDLGSFRRLRYGPESARPDATIIHGRLVPSARNDVESFADSLRRSHPRLEVTTWKDDNKSLVTALEIEKRMMTVVLGFVIALAVGLVLGLLTMMVIEKTRDIGILRSMGMSRSRVVLLFLIYGFGLGLVGTVFGAGFGVLLTSHLNSVVGWLGDNFGLEIFNTTINYRFRTIPVVLDWSRVLAISGFSLLLSFLAGTVAAWKASTLTPVVCLRYE